MKVKAIINFNDLENNAHRNIGDEFECSLERANFLLQHNAIEIIEQPIKEEIVVEPIIEVKHKKKNKKK